MSEFGRKSLFMLVASAVFAFPACAGLQDGESFPDPTLPGNAMADRLKARAFDGSSLKLRALVVGAGENGVALLGAAAGETVAVRAGARVSREIDSVAVSFAVKSVTSAGVEVEGEGGSGPLFLPGSFTPLPAPEKVPGEFLRYLEASDVRLDVLLRLVADQSGVNISTSDATARKTVSVFLRNVTAETAVEEICRTTGLWFRRESASGVLRVTTMEEYAENLGSFREEKTETFTLLYPNVTEVAGVIYGLYPDRTMLSLGEEEIEEDAENDLSRRFRRFQSISNNGGSSFLGMEAPAATGTASGSSGSGVFSFSRGGVYRIGSQWSFLKDARKLNGLTQGEAKQIDLALKAADTNSFETVFGRNTLQAANIFVTMSRKNNMLMVRTSDSRALDDIRDLVKRVDVPTPMVLLEMKLMELEVSDDFESTFQYQLADGAVKLGGTKAEVSGGFPGPTPLTSLLPSQEAITFQVLTRSISARIEALQKTGKLRTLATPTLLTANGEVSRIFDGSQIPIVRGISSQTTISESAAVSSPTTEFEYRDVGTMLIVTPNINADRTVTLRLLQENSERVEDGAKIPVYNATSPNPVAEASVDVVHSRSLSGTFIAKDGMAVAAGGLIAETEKEVRSSVPVLGSIPLIGWLFRSVEKVKERTELVVIIRPHVISTPMEGGRISRELLEAISAHPARDGRGSMMIHKAADGNDESLKVRSAADDVEDLVK